MRKLAFALLLAPLVAFADDPKKADPPKPADAAATPEQKFAALQKEYREAMTQVRKDMQAAKTNEERQKIDDAFQSKHEKLAKEALDLGKANPKADFAIDALLLATQDNTTDEAAIKFALDTYCDDARILKVVPMLGYRPNADKLLGKLADSKNTDVRGNVRFQQLSSEAERIDSGEAAKSPAETDKAFAGIAAKLADLVKEYGDVKIGSGPRAQTVAAAGKEMTYMLDHLVVGKVLPDAESAAVADGKAVKVSDYRGKVLVLDIWATWCGPCRAMIPHEKEMVEHFKDKPFALVSVSADDKKETLTSFLEKTEMPWTHWHSGPSGKLLTAYQVKFFPTVYVLDAKGVIRHKHLRDKALENAVTKLIAETEAKK